MLLYLDDSNNIRLTDKALSIRVFRSLYDYYTIKLNSEERAIAAFGVLYFMYYFDSKFLLEYEDEELRLQHVREYVHLGSEINDTKVFKEARDLYKELSNTVQVQTYLTMKKNISKLILYAQSMILHRPSVNADIMEGDEEPIQDDTVLVDHKEFSAVNSSLPKQQEDLKKYKTTLILDMQEQIDVYGGGELGAYE